MGTVMLRNILKHTERDGEDEEEEGEEEEDADHDDDDGHLEGAAVSPCITSS